jgi:hypothetical protein
VEPAGPDSRLRPSLLRPGPRIILGDPSQLLGWSWGQVVAWVVLLAAAGVDVAMFYQVLVLVMNAPEPVVWGAVVGFTAVALALAHRAGTQAREATNPRNEAGARLTASMCFTIWLVLGITAFIVRYMVQAAGDGGGSVFIVDGQQQPIGADSQTTSQHLSALLFLVLYLATGMVSGLAGWLRPNPAARKWKKALRKRSRASRRVADSDEKLAFARQLAASIASQRERRMAVWADAQRRCNSATVQLKAEARLMIEEARRQLLPAPPASTPYSLRQSGSPPDRPDADPRTIPFRLPDTDAGEQS